ncbi:hypothetical protein Aam_020_156 [Acidocella aminolytica 101 = DSM 11237]|uniref:Uncharacterized protein n=1 Tax=Acidocella aminolytica 101 = DSM 11237 TaxID=1120923 RepID=A0A0D6PCL2_9PROT|nr:hypothetical protein Aam_020_156 [Acidocella aminolytica 101 = DSM 11237]GBQ39320.1 hypothetical protein AA11237_2030 [Acidocella aminolytica 101 = DSM 11237]
MTPTLALAQIAGFETARATRHVSKAALAMHIADVTTPALHLKTYIPAGYLEGLRRYADLTPL